MKTITTTTTTTTETSTTTNTHIGFQIDDKGNDDNDDEDDDENDNNNNNNKNNSNSINNNNKQQQQPARVLGDYRTEHTENFNPKPSSVAISPGEMKEMKQRLQRSHFNTYHKFRDYLSEYQDRSG